MFPTFTNVNFMHLKMKSSCVSRDTYNHAFRVQNGPCGPRPGVAGQGLAVCPALLRIQGAGHVGTLGRLNRVLGCGQVVGSPRGLEQGPGL